MSRTKLLVILTALAVVALVSFNLWLSPLPSSATVRQLLEQQSMPKVSATNGETTATRQDAALRVEVIDTAVGVVALYTSTEGFGSTKLQREVFGWDVDSASWGSTTDFHSTRTVSYTYDQVFDYTQSRNTKTFTSGELFWGFRRMPQARSIAVTFNNGVIINHRFTEDYFSVVSSANGVMCSVTIADEHGKIIETLKLEPDQPAWIRPPQVLCQ